MTNNRREFLKRTLALAGFAAVGSGTYVLRPAWAAGDPVKVGIALDMTGGLGAVGLAGVNTAKMLAENINKAGGVAGRPVELYITDTASNEATGVANVRTMIQRDQPDVVFGGLASSMRNAIKDTIIGRGKTLYLYPSLYEGQECTQYLYCTGPTPAQQVDNLVPWLIDNGGKTFALPSSDYIWPQVLNEYIKKVIVDHGGEVVYEEYFPFDQVDFSAASSKILAAGANVVINNVIPPGGGSLIKNLHQAGFNTTMGGRFASFYYDENALNFNTAEEMEGLVSCLDWFQELAGSDPLSADLMAQYDAEFPGPVKFTAGNMCIGMYRTFYLWAKAVELAGTTDRDAMEKALDEVSIVAPGGGESSFVPGTRHCRMPMYIAVSEGGTFKVIYSSDGALDPKEC